MYVSQDPIRLAGGILNFYGYVDNTNAWIDIFGLDYVYQIVDSKTHKIKYIGITERDPRIRGNEHIDHKILQKGEIMEIIAQDVNHDQARTIEATKIREQIASAKAGGYVLVKDQLVAAGLRNKNRGRDIIKRPYNPATMGGSYSLLDKPREVKGLKKYKE